MAIEVFHGDEPIHSKQQDKFDFDKLADRIACALTEQAAGKGFVFGIEGKWGSGKSSLLALTLDHLRSMPSDKVATIEFRPWLIGDRDQLLTALFDDLVKAISEIEHARGNTTAKTKLAATSVAEKARKFGNSLSPIGKLASVAGLFVPGASIVGEVINNIAAAAATEPSGPTLAEQKEDLAASLSKLSCRIIVCIDDIDRLEPKETAEVLRLVRSVANFPNISYLLCYDSNALARAVERATDLPNGAAYLEKIIQTEVAVPRPESFALRRWFSSELQTFAQCAGHRVADLQYVIYDTGTRTLDSPRSVVRILDSLRVYWPSLSGRVDLADLVWLRMIAVASPNLYRWIEEYLVEYAALASGRAHISDDQRTSMGRRLDEALELDGLNWESLQFEFDRHLPGIETMSFGSEKDQRLFSRAGSDLELKLSEDMRLASLSHVRLYFTLVEASDSVTSLDIGRLVRAARKSVNSVAHVLLKMSAQKGDAGASKAEKLLDQLRYVEPEALSEWPIKNLILGLTNVADQLGEDDDGDDWGYPRTWYLARGFLRAVRSAIEPEQFQDLLKHVFETGSSLGFLSYLLRDETFNQGFYGDRPKPNDLLFAHEGFEAVRAIMMGRYADFGIDRVIAHRAAATILYAWSQSGGRRALVRLVKQQQSDDKWLTRFLRALCGPRTSLSLEALANFFDEPTAIVRRAIKLFEEKPSNRDLKRIVSAIQSSVHFEGNKLEDVLDAWDQREREKD